MEVAAPAVSGHLGHGDERGPCTDDAIIDADGTASRFSGDPQAREVSAGDELATFPVDNINESGLDAFDQDGDASGR